MAKQILETEAKNLAVRANPSMSSNGIKAFLLLCCLFSCAHAYAMNPAYRVINRFQLGGEGGWDCLAVDSEALRLYISRSTRVMVVDIETGKQVGEVPDTPGVHAIALAPELNRGFTSNGGTDTATIFDLKTLKVIGQVKAGANPDAIVYDPFSKMVFSFNGRSQDATVFDARSGEVVKTIALAGKPELAAADGKGKVYVNIENTSEVAEIDSQKLSVTNRFLLEPGREPTGIAVDPEHHRVFSGCHNKLMTILDTESGKVIATVPIGERVDGNGFDHETGLAFSSNGDGTLTVAREFAPGKFEVAETVTTQAGARTMAIDSRTHNIYLPTAEFVRATEPNTRPAIIKDSFVVLVIGR